MKHVAIILFMVALVISGCKSTEYVPVVRDVYHNSTDTVRDSVCTTVYVREYTKGDTVYVDRERAVYKDRLTVKTDTVVIHDTIPSAAPGAAAREKKTAAPVTAARNIGVLVGVGFWVVLSLLMIKKIKAWRS